MTHTISLVSDHKGNTRPKVIGDEYLSVGDMTTTAYRIGSPINASVNIDADTDENLTRASGDFVADGFVVGDYVTIVGSAGANDAHLIEFGAVTALIATTTAATALTADTGGGEVITHAGEKILASSFGLTTITTAEVISQESMLERYVISAPQDNGAHFYLYAFNTNADNNSTLLGASLVGAANAAAGATPLGSIRLKVTGNI
tara:strand:+ start:6611 stop:7222 length:612 start_codon:yes stop_codon:yes gene_type:complete